MSAGGVGPYFFSVNSGPYVDSTTFSLKSGDNQIISAKDSNGCIYPPAAYAFTLFQTNPLTISHVSSTDNWCYQGTSGTTTVRLYGGATNYTFKVDDAAYLDTESKPVVLSAVEPSSPTDYTFTSLSGGPKVITVTDGDMCSTTLEVTIPQVTRLTVTATPQASTCESDVITVTVSQNGTALVTLTIICVAHLNYRRNITF